MHQLLRPLVLLLVLAASAINAEPFAANIASLIAPSKLATLGPRGANPRIEKCVFWLATAKEKGNSPAVVAQQAVEQAGMRGEAAALTEAKLLRNLDIAEKLGCLDAEGLTKLRYGNAPIVMRGPYSGQQLSVDHIIPRAVAPELDNVIANLELLPLRVNQSKNDKIGVRQLDLAMKLHSAGLLSLEGMEAVQRRAK